MCAHWPHIVSDTTDEKEKQTGSATSAGEVIFHYESMSDSFEASKQRTDL